MRSHHRPVLPDLPPRLNLRAPTPVVTGFLLLILCVLAGGAGSLGVRETEGVQTGIDSLVPLPPWVPRDEVADLRLVPHELTVDPLGRLWLLDRARARVLPVSEIEGDRRSFSVAMRQNETAQSIADLSASGTYIFLLEPSTPNLIVVDLDGNIRERIDLSPEISRSSASGFLPSRLLVGRSGDLWLFESRGVRVLHFDRRGVFLDSPLDALGGSERPKRIADVAATPDDGILLLDPTRPALFELDANGGLRSVRDLGARLREPVSLAVDPAGNRYVLDAGGRVLVSDRNGHRIWEGSLVREEGFTGPRRTAITADWILYSGDPSTGRLERWRIVRAPQEDVPR